jgi:hypothetical protein
MLFRNYIAVETAGKSSVDNVDTDNGAGCKETTSSVEFNAFSRFFFVILSQIIKLSLKNHHKNLKKS